MKIEHVDIGLLIEYGLNAKEHPEEQVEQIAKSIERFGFNDPIAVDEKFVIIEGHGRLMAAKKLGIKEVPIIKLEHLSEDEKRAYILAHNKLTMNSGFDIEKLRVELSMLNDCDLDLELTGFSADEIDDILHSETTVDDEKKNDVPFVDEAKIVIKKGDLIELGDHRLLCGDATNESDVKKVMFGVFADMVVTDPPYNVDYEGKTAKKLKIENDKMDNSSFREFLNKSFRNMNDVLKPGGVFYIWHADSEGYNFRGACFDIGWEVRQCLIWNKNTLVMGRQDYHWKHEPCLYGWKDGAGHLWASDRKQTTIIDYDRPTKNELHPTMKPVGLIEYCILNNSKGGDIVIDFFLGSGTTLIAADGIGRRCFGIEYDQKYAQTIVQRWCDFSGVDEIKINGKKVSWVGYKNGQAND